MAILTLFLAPLAAFAGAVLYGLYWLKVNYDIARKSGLPIVILPFDSANPLWMVLYRPVIAFVRRIPFCANSNFVRFNWRGWEIVDRYRLHEERGDAVLFVTPGNNYLQLCDEKAMTDIFTRRQDFGRPSWASEMLDVFGPNLSTAQGATWQKHRKITASCFNEVVNRRVWHESIRQASSMIEHWSSQPSVNSVSEDARTVSLHVMSGAAFGKSYDWRPHAKEAGGAGKESSESYAEALRIVIDKCIPLLVLGKKNLGNPLLPESFKELHRATIAFQDHMTRAYEDEKQAIQSGTKQESTLMSSLVRAARDGPDGVSDGLTEQEIYGNIFVYNFAGHDATANSLAYAIFLMATRPDVQDWLADEINHVLAETDTGQSSYQETFPRLKRCLAVTHETSRLYTAVPIMKGVGDRDQPLELGGKTVILPKHTIIIPNYSALHTHPRYWGANSLDFDPSRWIESGTGCENESEKVSGSTSFDAESFKEPAKMSGRFVAWSAGNRSCPGRKFAQVEFVGVLASLFGDHKVKPVPQPGETDAMARDRLADQIRTDSGMKLLLQVLHPEKVVLQWTRR